MKLLLLIVILLSASTQVLAVRRQKASFPPDREMRPFATDGCTMAPDGTVNRPRLFRPCCVAHDLRYWGGGTSLERDRADLALRACVRELGGPGWATIFYNGVRAGRLSPWTIAAKRWGNAWYEHDGYRQLSAEELQRLIDAVPGLKLPEEMKALYLSELLARLPAVTETNP